MVRSVLLSGCVALLGCRGESVEAASPDAATETTSETAATDTAAADAVTETIADAGACMLPGNILVNGDFSAGFAGWTPNNASTEVIAGPCGGRGIRVFNATDYASIRKLIYKPLAAGTTVRLRAYFRALPAAALPPALVLGFRHLDDAGGEVSTEESDVVAPAGADWAFVDVSLKLARDEDIIDVLVTSRSPDADEFAVAAVSVVVE